MSQFHQYDPLRVAGSFGEVFFDGPADGTFISVEREEDAFSKEVGAGGDVVRVRSRNRSGSVTLTLQASSPANDRLSALLLADEQFGTGIRPIFIKDLNGTTLIHAAAAWIKKAPTVDYGDEGGSREWVFDCAELSIFAGGGTLIG